MNNLEDMGTYKLTALYTAAMNAGKKRGVLFLWEEGTEFDVTISSLICIYLFIGIGILFIFDTQKKNWLQSASPFSQK